MSVVWHSSLTAEETKKIENIQKTCFKIILGDSYTDYQSSLLTTEYQELSVRREARCLSFARKCLRTPLAQSMFPENPAHVMDIRQSEKYVVNFARTENYRKSSVPYCQRLLNKHNRMEEDRRRMRREESRRMRREEATAGGREGGTRHQEREEGP